MVCVVHSRYTLLYIAHLPARACIANGIGEEWVFRRVDTTDGAAAAVKCHILVDDLRREMVLNTWSAEIRDVPGRHQLLYVVQMSFYIKRSHSRTAPVLAYNIMICRRIVSQYRSVLTIIISISVLYIALRFTGFDGFTGHRDISIIPM